MAYRKISLSIKVQIFTHIFQLINKTEIAKKFGIDPGTLIYIINEKVIPSLKTILADEKTGPKVENKKENEVQTTHKEKERPSSCHNCGSTRIWKNGFYLVLNWFVLLFPIKRDNRKKKIQRYICADCHEIIHSYEKEEMAHARKEGKIQLNRLVVFSKFKLRLSHRLIQKLIDFIYPNMTVSIGYVDRIIQYIGAVARKFLQGLKDCPQKVSKVMMADETFPKIIGKGRNFGKTIAVAICENGVIRAVKSVYRKKHDLKILFKNTMGKAYSPLYFLSDYDKLYPALMQDINQNIKQLKDIVHTIRIIFRYFETAIRDITIDYPKSLSFKERKKQKRLKQRLLRKCLRPIQLLLFKAFAHGNEAIAHIYIEAALSELEQFCVKTHSVYILHKKLTKFFNKYMDTLIFQLEHRDEIVSTTNAIESKNSIIKAFTKAAKSYQKAETCERTINGIVLMENFDIKTRGLNRGTSAFTRANISTEAEDFFDCVGLAA